MDGHLLAQVQQLQGEDSAGIAFGEPEGHGLGHPGAAGRGAAPNWEDYLLQQQAVDDYESEADTISTEQDDDEELYDYSLDDAAYMDEIYGYHHHDYDFGQEWMPEPGPSLERAPYTRIIRTNHSILTRPVDAGISSAGATVDVATREMANQLVTEAAVRAAAAAAATLHDDPTIDASEDVFLPGGIRDSTIASEVLHMVSQGREYTPLPPGQQHPITPGAQLKELAEQEVSAGGTPYHEQDDFFLPRYTPRAACRDSFVNIPPPIPPVGPAFHTKEGYTLGEDVEHTVESGRCLFARRLKDLVGLRKADAAEGRREGQTAHDPAAPSGPAPPPPLQGRRGPVDGGAWDDALKQQQQQQQMAVSVKKLHITGPAGKAEKSVRMVKRRPVSLSKRGDAPNRNPKNVSFQSMAVHGRGAANRRRKASPGPLGQDGIRGISLSSGVAFSPRGGEKPADKQQQADLQLRRGRPPLPPGVAPSTSRRGC